MSLYVVVVGGGNVGFQLGKRLIARSHEVVILEKSGERAATLCNLLGDEYVMVGDGCDLLIQKEAGFNRADVIVAVTGEDEDNLIACQLAKEIWNVGRVIARVNDPSHEEVFKEIGIDDTVSATGIIYSLIDQQITSEELIQVGHLHKGQLEVVESLLSEKSPLVGKPLKDVPLPYGTSIVYIVRAGDGMEVDPETIFETEDMVVAIVPVELAEDFRSVLLEKL